MSPPNDPPRMADSDGAAPASLKRALGAARNVAPSQLDLAALAARLPMGPGPVGPANPPGNGPANPPGDGPAPNLGGAGGAGGAGAAAAVAAKIAIPSVLPGIIAGALLGLVASGTWLAVTDTAPPATTRPVPALIERAPAERPAPPALAATTLTAPTPSTAVIDPAQAAAPSAIATATADPQESEAELLQRARAQARSNPGATLSLVAEHAARFPRGLLGQEREVIAITALVAAGRSAEGHARAERFFAAFPSSAHRRRIEALFGSPKNDSTHHNPPGPLPPTP